jgi:hypothetical protein
LAFAMRATGPRESLASRANFRNGWRVRRRVSILSVCSDVIHVRGRCGRLVRSWQPAMPSFLKRLRHLETVAGETPPAPAMARGFAGLAPPAIQGSHVRRRPGIPMNVHSWGSRGRGASQTPQTSVSPREQPRVEHGVISVLRISIAATTDRRKFKLVGRNERAKML